MMKTLMCIRTFRRFFSFGCCLSFIPGLILPMPGLAPVTAVPAVNPSPAAAPHAQEPIRLQGAQTIPPVSPAQNQNLPAAGLTGSEDLLHSEVLGGRLRSKETSLMEIEALEDLYLKPDAPQIDPGLQTVQGTGSMPALVANFEGQGNTYSVLPPDTTGQVGPNHYVQMVNFTTAVYDKNGNLLYSPFLPSRLWPSGDVCNLYNHGDPVVLYDPLADRWLLSQFALPNFPNGPFYECIAISRGPAPTNLPADWYAYTFPVSATKMNDYPKLGVWPDGYYMTANQFEGGALAAGAGVWVFDRVRMLAGQPAAYQYFDLADLDSSYWALLPANLMGAAPPPAGAPNYLAGVAQDWNGPGDVMHLFAFQASWADPSLSTFTLLKELPVDPFDGLFTGGRANIPQMGTEQRLDAIGGQLMMHLWYRNFGDHEVLVANHTVDVNGLDQAGIRWYEIRNPGPSAYIFQQGTYAPDPHHRWMGSIAMDGAGNLALGYSISSATLYPGIRVAGREAGDPLGLMTAGEAVVIQGGGWQKSTTARWGDYSTMSVDPFDDCTFWYTTEYYTQESFAGWRTRVAAFRFPSCIAERGSLSGSITLGDGQPVAGALVTADSGVKSFFGYSGSDGAYGFGNLPAGLYTLSVEAYGYQPFSQTGVEIRTGDTTHLDIQLETAAQQSISGIARDAVSGWPLYARIDIEGYPDSPIWTDPETGAYRVDLAEGRTYTLKVSAWVDGYLDTTLNLPMLTAPAIYPISLLPDRGACTAPGYAPSSLAYGEDFEITSGGYASAGTGSEWAWGTPSTWPSSCPSGESCWGTDLSGNYQPNVSQSLTSPVITLTAYTSTTPLGLRWKQAWEIESAVYDQAYTEFSIDNGPWQTLWMHQGPSVKNGWTEMTADLSAAAGKTVRLRWRLISDSGIEFAGLYIDHVRITAGCDMPPGGLVVGQVEDEAGQPLPGAQVAAAAGGHSTARQTPLDSAVRDAFYTVYAAPGANTVTASGVYGYAPKSEDLVVLAGSTVEQDFSLSQAEVYTLLGSVRDAATGWPLYARIDIDGYPGSPIWSDPYTGQYQVSLPGATAFTMHVSAWLPGYVPASRSIGFLTGAQEQEFSLDVNALDCSAPGYQSVNGLAQTFTLTAQPPGWTVVNLGSSPGWRFDDPGGVSNLTGGAGGFAIADSDYAGLVYMDTQLRTPAIDLSQKDQVALSFKTRFRHNRSEVADVDVSTNGAAGPWVNVWRQSGADYPEFPGVEVLDITALAARQANVMVRFHYYGANFDWWWQVDDVVIGTPQCLPPPGGLAAGNIFDSNTGQPLVGVNVVGPQGLAAVTQVGPQAEVTPAFYTFYAPPGTQVYTATIPGTSSGYGPAIETIDIPGGALVRQDFQLPAGQLDFSPSDLETMLEVGQSGSFSLTLTNSGDLPAAFTLEAAEIALPASGPIQQPAFVVKPFKQDYRATAPSEAAVLPSAPGYPAGQVIRSWQLPDHFKGWGIAYASDLETLWVSSPSPEWGGSDLLAEFTLSGALTKRSSTHDSPHTFGPADLAYERGMNRIWAMNVNSESANCIYAIHPGRGYTGEQICPGGEGGFHASQRGLAYDPTTHTWFAAGWNEGMVYRFSSSGEILAAINTGLPVSGLAYSPAAGRLYALSSSSETRIYVLDVDQDYAVIGLFAVAGFSPYGGAGLEIDCSGALWAVDQTTGKVFQIDSGESPAACTRAPSWITLDVDSGILPAHSSQVITGQIDANAFGLEQPGTFLAEILAQSDTPYPPARASITLTLTAPPSWGVVEGVISSQGLCDASLSPLAGALVKVENESGFQFDMQTSQSGEYEIWLDSLQSPYTLTVSALGHLPPPAQAAAITAGDRLTIDADLRLYKPCLKTSVQSLSGALDLRHSQELTFTLVNTGAAPANYGIMSSAPWLSVLPAQGILSSGEEHTITARMDANQVQAAGIYTASLRVTAEETTLDLPVTMTVMNPYGLVLWPADLLAYGPAGSTISYTMRLKNTGTQADVYSVSATGAGSGWTVTLPQTSIALAPGAEHEVVVFVNVASESSLGASRLITIRVQSTHDPLWWTEAVLKAISGQPPQYFPLIFKP